jgi:hypothetical protein
LVCVEYGDFVCAVPCAGGGAGEGEAVSCVSVLGRDRGTTLAGTTMADFADRSLGIGYPGGASILFALVIASLVVWKFLWGRFRWTTL